jgi:hypothetical protein
LAFNYSKDSVDIKIPLSSLPFSMTQKGNEVFQSDKVSRLVGVEETLDLSLKPKGYLVVKMKGK